VSDSKSDTVDRVVSAADHQIKERIKLEGDFRSDFEEGQRRRHSGTVSAAFLLFLRRALSGAHNSGDRIRLSRGSVAQILIAARKA
jgi:hypothetical protein